MAYVETPRTDAGNATFMTNGLHVENFSVENSLLSPIKRKDTRDELLSQMRNGRGSLKTPRARIPLADRHNLPSVPARQEFTPLLQSVTKKNFERKGRLSGQPETPAFLKGSLRNSDSPALPGVEVSALYGSELGSSVVGDSGSTPMPLVASSSAQSTPLAVLPKRDAAGVLNDQGNLMTLREQENIINKIEKENFGLKLKIHFLEESLRKSGPGFNEAALKENTDLKVDRITLQKELSRCKKMLSQAERDVEALRRLIEDTQQKAKHKQADEKLWMELETLRQTLSERETEVEEMRVQVEAVESRSDEVEKLKLDIEELEVDLREKDRLLDERDDEIDNIKAQAKKDAEELDAIEAELDEARKRVDEVENDEGKIAAAAEKLEEVQAELEEALEARERAEADLDKLRDEMSNKSINNNGLSRQLEDKANKLQDDLNDLRERHMELQESFDDKSREAKRLKEDIQDHEQNADICDQRLKDQNELLRSERDSMVRKCESLNEQMQRAVKDLETTSEEKDLLHSRHDALTTESQQLQKDLSKARVQMDQLEQDLDDEKRHAENNDRQLRSEARDEISRLSERINNLQRELEDKESQIATDKDLWEGQRRALESQKEKADQQAAGLQRTISKLHETEGTLSGREMQLQQALDSEKQRHESEEAVLERQTKDLNAEVDEKRQALDDLRSDLSDAREDLRVSQRDQADLEEKVQALEDEIEVLQSGLDEEVEKAQEETNLAKLEVDSLRSQLKSAKEQLSSGQASDTQEQRTKAESESHHRAIDRELHQVRSEKQSLQDKIATNSLEMHKLRLLVAEIEAERDELQSQLKQMHGQVDETFKLDQEKLELRSAKLRLEYDANRLRKEQKSLSEKNDALERNLQDEISRAGAEEARLNDEIADLRRNSSSTSGRDRELTAAKQKIERLETRISEVENRPPNDDNLGENAAELSLLQKDLAAARKKETDYLKSEVAQKDIIRDLKRKIGQLEREHHEAEIARASVDSPKSSLGGSARKSELVELRGQLIDVQRQLRDARTKSKDELKSLQQRLLASDKQTQDKTDVCEELEAGLLNLQHDRTSLQTANAASTATISRLRTRISALEEELRTHHRTTTADETIAEERKDLHDLLKDSKLQTEDLQLQVASRESSIAAAATREKDLRAQLKRVREERSLQTQRSSALATELDSLQQRYQRALEDLSRQQRVWEGERKAMTSRVRFPNVSISELHANEKELEKRHVGELRGLAKQIQWLRAKLQREGAFREGLMYEKKWLMMRIGMFEACNATDLQLLSEMGVTPTTDPAARTRLRLGDALRRNASRTADKKPSLRTVAFVIIAGARMRRMASEWAFQRKTKEALARKAEGMGMRRASYVR